MAIWLSHKPTHVFADESTGNLLAICLVCLAVL